MKAVAVLTAALALVACSDQAAAPQPPAPPAPPPAPALPDLPMTMAKASAIMGSLPSSCIQVATLRFQQNRCEQKIGKGPDDAGLRQEIADYRAQVSVLPTDQARTRCTARYEELLNQPMPKACWGQDVRQ